MSTTTETYVEIRVFRGDVPVGVSSSTLPALNRWLEQQIGGPVAALASPEPYVLRFGPDHGEGAP